MEQSVRPNETHCSTRRNKPFCVLKQAVILGETKTNFTLTFLKLPLLTSESPMNKDF